MTNSEVIEILRKTFSEYKKDKEQKLLKEERALDIAIKILSEKEKDND